MLQNHKVFISGNFINTIQSHLGQLRDMSLAIILICSLLSPITQPPAYAMDVPTPLSPGYGTTTTIHNYPPLGIPEVTWSVVSGATLYHLQFSQDIGFSNIKLELNTANTSYTPIAGTIFSDGDWYWRIRVEQPQTSNYSSGMKFTKQWATPDNKPILSSPNDGINLDFYVSPNFTWQPVLGAARYRFQIATSSDFNSSTLKYDQTTLATSHQPYYKWGNGQYFWRVIPTDPGDHDGTPSDVRTVYFSYGLKPSFANEIPTLLEPLDKYDPSYIAPTFTPTFRWTAVKGAQFYRLDYTSDPTCNFGQSTTTVETRNPSYTPVDAFPNDVNYCWRVRAQSGLSISDWSDTWEFQKKWYIQAVPLTPVNNYQNTKNPFYSWTPVPGAAYYVFQISSVNSFLPPWQGQLWQAVNPYIVPGFGYGASNIWYWRVTPFDRNNNAGKPSDGNPHPRPFSFIENYNSLAPDQVYPLYYYIPNSFPPPDDDVAMQPHEDRTVPLPIFMWHRVFNLSGDDPAQAYRIEVNQDPLFLSSPDWEFDTENLSAIPTSADPFNPDPNLIYYWRVCVLDSLGGSRTSPWSQIWQTKIDTSKGLTPTATITLLRPLPASEQVELTPLFEWWPLQNATSYAVQISQDPNFATTTIDTTVPYPAFTPQTSLAQRSLGHLTYGTYYWRVRGFNGSNPLGSWSAPWRFQIASQSQWRDSRTLGDSANQLEIASNPADVITPTYQLSKLYAAQDANNWYFGFNVSSGTDMAYGLYLDYDYTDGSGANVDGRGYHVTAIPAHKPEYAIYVFKRSSSFSADQVAIYRWTGTQWANNPQTLSAVGGALYSTASFVEIGVPNTAIGMAEETSSAAISLFSVNENDKNVQDTVPASTSNTVLDRFTSVSERMNLSMPPTNASGDPITFAAVPPFFFNYPIKTLWRGYNIQISLDPRFTTIRRNFASTSNAYYAPPMYTEDSRVQDIQGDNTYYWRIRPEYSPSNIFGAWSQAGRFERSGFIPQNLHESVTFATPTFSWDIVEGAAYYEIQVDSDPNFGSVEVNANTSQTSYTPLGTLANGTYYWRVRASRYATDASIPNDWSPSQSFILNLPVPANLVPNDPTGVNPVRSAPTLCWDPIIASANGVPVLAAWKYRVQVSKNDPNFSVIYDWIDTEQNCWTPFKGYDDAKYYWRVAMIDGNNLFSDFSPAATFTKQYPHTTLLSPINGSTVFITPTFVWTPVNGAARYRLEVSLSPTFAPLYDSVETNNTRYTPTIAYLPDKTYYWRVAMIDRDGRWGPFNNATIIISPGYKIYLPFVRR